MAVNVRENSEAKTRVLVGMATCGIAAGARPVLTTISDEVNKRELHDVLVTQTGCIGICQFEPIVEVIDENGTKTTYVKMPAEKALGGCPAFERKALRPDGAAQLFGLRPQEGS